MYVFCFTSKREYSWFFNKQLNLPKYSHRVDDNFESHTTKSTEYLNAIISEIAFTAVKISWAIYVILRMLFKDRLDHTATRLAII